MYETRNVLHSCAFAIFTSGIPQTHSAIKFSDVSLAADVCIYLFSSPRMIKFCLQPWGIRHATRRHYVSFIVIITVPEFQLFPIARHLLDLRNSDARARIHKVNVKARLGEHRKKINKDGRISLGIDFNLYYFVDCEDYSILFIKH